MNEQKPDLNCLFRDNPKTPEGKYLVTRRDGTTVEWPSFVLGARDPNGADALRFYALLCLLPEKRRDQLMQEMRDAILAVLAHPDGQNKDFVRSVLGWAERWDAYRQEHGDGDLLKGAHRVDDPATIARMREGFSA